MDRPNRKLCNKKIGELTQKEFEQLFNVSTDITEPSFRERIKTILDESIASIDIEKYKIEDMDFVMAYLLGSITALQTNMQKGRLIALFGNPRVWKIIYNTTYCKIKAKRNDTNKTRR